MKYQRLISEKPDWRREKRNQERKMEVRREIPKEVVPVQLVICASLARLIIYEHVLRNSRRARKQTGESVLAGIILHGPIDWASFITINFS